jgi:hypothetical protein
LSRIGARGQGLSRGVAVDIVLDPVEATLNPVDARLRLVSFLASGLELIYYGLLPTIHPTRYALAVHPLPCIRERT